MRQYLPALAESAMDVTVVVVNYNTSELTERCLSSIFKNTKGVSYEVVVVDNGSSDGSYGTLSRIFSKSEIFRIIRNNSNLGFARACNQGIKEARGNYIFLLNSDTEFVEDTLQELLKFAGGKSDVGVVGPKLLNSDETTQSSVYRLPTLIRALQQYWLVQKGILDKYFPRGSIPVEVECVIGGAFLITPKALKKIGLLDERYFMYFEDLDYCRRVRKAGFSVYYYPQTQVIHHHGASGKGMVLEEQQWKRLIPSSKIYHGVITHYLISFVIWFSQKWQRLLKTRETVS